MINELTSTSYNPCSNGILINEFLQFRRLTFFRLNPCSNGILINKEVKFGRKPIES